MRAADNRRMSPPALQAAIVDLDGTMVDTVGDFEVALARTLADLGWPAVGRAFIARTVGKGSEHLLQRTLADVAAIDLPAFLALWERLPGHRWMARLARLPILYSVLNVSYHLFARVRPYLPRRKAA